MPLDDVTWMVRAVNLARRADARVEPNPRVGALVVRNGRVLGEGFHPKAGEPHAEVFALRAAGESARGSTLYVTLEPCNHTGRTPPCTEAVLKAGIARVVVGVADPNPAVAGGGAEVLRARGVAVEYEPLAETAADLIAPFAKAVRTGLPHVTLKWAMSLDGRIATRTRASRWLTSEATRARTRTLRAQFGAILVGSGTARADDPLLTSAEPAAYTPLRVVLDSGARLPVDGQLARTAREHPVLVATAPSAPADRVAALEAAGCAVWQAPADTTGRPDPVAVLRHLVSRGVHSVLVEGGATAAASFLEAGLADEIHALVAPLVLGGADALSPVGGSGAADPADAWRARILAAEPWGDDLFVRARLLPRERPGQSP